MTDESRPEGHGAERRRFPRTGVVWAGRFEMGGHAYECLALNLSANGACVHMMETPPETAGKLSGILNLPRLGTLDADVVWRRNNAMGLQFRADPAVVARMLREVLPGSRAATPPVADTALETGTGG